MKLSLAAAAVVAAAVLAPGANGQAPVQDSVTFSGSSGGFAFEIDVHSGPSGESPTGRVLGVSSGTTFLDAQPSCLAIYPPPVVGAGRIAVVNVVFPTGLGDVATFQLRETLGSPGFGSFELALSDRSPTDCSQVSGANVISGSGQLVIVDAPPLPTSKDDCRNGGWRSYGVFKNQGDCVSFVATGGKNAPASSP